MNMRKQFILPIGTEIRTSQIGYYDYWYPNLDGASITGEEIEVTEIAGQDIKFSSALDWKPYLVSPEIAKFYNSPVSIIWIKETT